MNTAIWSDISTPILGALSKALRAGLLFPQFPPSTLSSIIPADQVAPVGQSLRDLSTAGLSPEVLATLLDLLIEDRRRRPPPDEVIDLVLTGPDSPEIASRDTLVVIDELFAQAVQSLTIVGYAIHQGESIFNSLAQSMRKNSGLTVEMLLNIQRPMGDTTSERELIASFLDRLKNEQWPPNSPLPAVYYFPAALDNSGTIRAALHAKCIIADRKTTWISSANFTSAARKRNIEVGVLLRVESLSCRLADHFNILKQRNILQRIA